jgi:TRAP-type C4-dicarboxylate transport system substrate-binding protein
MRGWAAGILAAWLIGAGAGLARADETMLIFATDGPTGTHVAVRVFHPWAEHINEVGKGVLHLDVRDGMSIVNPRNFYDRVQNDVAQIAWGSLGNLTGTFPHAEFSMLPFQAEKSVDASVAFWRLFKNGQLDPDFKDVVPLMMTVYPQADVHLAKPPKSIDTLQPYKLAEVTSYHYEMRLGASTGMVFMAKKRYDALPAAAKKILDENSGEAASRTLGLAWDEVADEARKAAEADSKQQVVVPTPEALAKWQKITAPIAADWVKNTPGGEKVLTAFRTYLAEIKTGK